MLKTLAEAKAYSLKDISGSCNNSPEFLGLLNECIQDLMRRGDLAGTVTPIQVCAYRGCVVFNRYVGQVRKLNICRYPNRIQNLWTNYLDYSPSAPWRSWLGPECGTIAGGLTPVFQDIMGDNRLVRGYPSVQADIGKLVRIYGTDNNGQPLRYRASDGNWYDGWTMTLANPYGVTTDGAHPSPLPIRHIDRILIDDGMQGILRLYAYNTVTSLLEPLGEYMPGETNPEYRKYQIMPGCGIGGLPAFCNGMFSVIALVKLRFIPVVYDTDLVLVDNLKALKYYMQSQKFAEAGDSKSADQYEARAIRELNLELRDEFPDDQIPVSMGELGTSNVGFQRVF